MQFYTLVIKSLHLGISLPSTLFLASTILFFSLSVVKIMLSFSINRPSMQLLEREGPNNRSLITLSTKKIMTNKLTIAETNTFHNRKRT